MHVRGQKAHDVREGSVSQQTTLAMRNKAALASRWSNPEHSPDPAVLCMQSASERRVYSYW